MKRQLPKIGRGKKLSIAKAGLVLYYWLVNNYEYFSKDSFFDYGELPYMHAIINIAGARHCSFLTSRQVISCLRNSPYWDCECINLYPGIGNGRASICQPSEKGRKYFETKLSNIKIGKEVIEDVT